MHPDPKRIDPDVGHMEPPAEGWVYQDGAGWYDPASIEATTDQGDNDGV